MSTTASWTAASVVARSVGGDPAERRRRRLLAAATAGCTAFGLAGVSLALFDGQLVAGETCTQNPDGGFTCIADPVTPSLGTGWGPGAGLAPYVVENGLRPGVVTAALLLVVPFAVFGLQVLRLGSAARERRLAALMVHGATSADLRRVAAAEAWPAGVRGAVVGLPGYLALWAVLGLAAPPGWRLLPPPGVGVLLGWPVAVLLVAGAAAAAAAWSSRAVVPDVLGQVRRRARPVPLAAKVVPVVLVVLLAVLLGLGLSASAAAWTRLGVAVGAPLLLVAISVSLGPWLVLLGGRLAVRSGDPVRVLAGRRLLADPRTPGRPAGVLFAVGLAVGVACQGLADVLVPGQNYDVLFYAGGYLLATFGIAFAAVVAAAALVVGAGEQVLDAARPTAATVALGAGPSTVRRILRIQLTTAAVSPAAVGAVAGSLLLGGLLVLTGSGERTVYAAAGFVAAVLLAGGAAAFGAAVAGRLLRGTLEESMSVENLRTS